ncbi:MAG: hypothetical protein LBF37_03260, partial [Rickettsiales bacterium]|nr:hypothetical protein [Rickettsiales bacterium]
MKSKYPVLPFWQIDESERSPSYPNTLKYGSINGGFKRVKELPRTDELFAFLDVLENYSYTIVIQNYRKHPNYFSCFDPKYHIVDHELLKIPEYLPKKSLGDILLDPRQEIFYIRPLNSVKYIEIDLYKGTASDKHLDQFELPGNLKTIASSHPLFKENLHKLIEQRNIKTQQDMFKFNNQQNEPLRLARNLVHEISEH